MLTVSQHEVDKVLADLVARGCTLFQIQQALAKLYHSRPDDSDPRNGPFSEWMT
jgi:hypothetical protein